MKEYCMTLTAVAGLGCIMGMLSPEGNLKKYIRLTVSLCLLCAIVQPMVSLLLEGEWSTDLLWKDDHGEEIVDYDDIYNQTLLLSGEKQVSSFLKKQIVSEFKMQESSVDVITKIEMKNDIAEVQGVWITLKEEAIFTDPKEILSFINKQLECPCTILYD